MSFESLFSAHSRALLAYAMRRTTSVDDAVDVVAETMLIAWRRSKDVPGGDETRPWLFGVARNVLANLHRTDRRRDRLGARLKERLSGLHVPDHSDDVGTAVVVRQALARLDDDDREILRLTAWEGLAPADLAIALAVPPATARTRLFRARNRLRDQLRALGWTNASTSDGHESGDEHVLVRKAKGI